MENKNSIKKKLIKIFGADSVSDKQHDLYLHSYDATENEAHLPDFICLVENSKQLVQVIKLANEQKIPLVPYITGNNIGGLTIPVKGGIILDFSKKMNKVIHVDEDQMYAILEPGVTFGQLDAYLKKHHPNLRYCYPFAPPYSGVVGNAILSGMNNLSATHGSMGDWINGLEVVLHDGSIVKIGSCFTKEEENWDKWYSRYPMPDLMGLFVNWQGMTGLVTKCAVQLWLRKKIQTFIIAMTYGGDATAELIREFGRLELIDDLSAVSLEVAKMSLGFPTPKKFDFEPDYAILIPISAHSQKHFKIKMELLNEALKIINNRVKRKIILTDFNYLSAILGEGVRCFADLPNVVIPLVEYSGLTWIGSYAPINKLKPLMEEGEKIFKKYQVPAFIYMKSMKGSHYAIWRPIIRFKKHAEEKKVHEICKELLEMGLHYGIIPYKTPIWITEYLKEKIIDPNWVKFFTDVKKFMDPNNIFNPGRWGI
ncbi:MAG: FAD-binding oxidoreductase [Candidatus Lokiarchaeota archaeon]|nr:FAD-binding oxidoreductase [Candidatus Lokiarchaeota archaeon]